MALFAAGSAAATAVLAVVRLDPAISWRILVMLPITGFAVSGVVTSLYTLAADI